MVRSKSESPKKDVEGNNTNTKSETGADQSQDTATELIAHLQSAFKFNCDGYLLTITAISALFYSILISKPDYYVLNEKYYIDLLWNYQAGKFVLSPNPPGYLMIMNTVMSILGLGIDTPSDTLTSSSSLQLFYLRLVSALSGASAAPLSYLILKTLNVTPLIAFMGSFLVLSNSALCTDSRFTSPNSLMVMFSLISLLLLCKIVQESYPKYITYVILAVSLGLSMTVLHLGLVSYLFIALFVAYHEFDKFGDLSRPERELWLRYTKVVGTVCVVPLLIYYLSYCVYIAGAKYSGTTDHHLSPHFQVW